MSGSKGSESSASFSESFVDPKQSRFLKDLYKKGFRTLDRNNRNFRRRILNPATSSFKKMLNPEQNPALPGLIDQAQFYINENLTENLLPAIGDEANMYGQLGGDRQGIAEGIVTRDALRLGEEASTNLIAQDYERQQAQILQALSLAPSIGSLAMQPLTDLSQILGRPTVLSRGQGEGEGEDKSLGF